MSRKKQPPASELPITDGETDAAITRGMIAALSGDCARASGAISEIVRRCGVIAKRGKLSEAQSGLVKRMERNSEESLGIVRSIREAAELLAVHGEINGNGK